jgi:hypothetical protein
MAECSSPGRVTVIIGAEGDGDPGITIGGEYLEPARRLGGESPYVGVAADLVPFVQQVPDRGGRLQPDLIRERATVGVGVDRYHPVAAERGERRAEPHRRGRLADAALKAQHRDPVVAARDRGSYPADEIATAHLGRRFTEPDQPAGDPVDVTAPARSGRHPLAVQQRLGGQGG